ncbi:PAS domain S-box protein [Kamptonema formosum]|uniref:PAS domain S-box protein n=1 Tax=Kamptonema formosum TaxID=331992 RepID=UPI000345972A|nr:PAS domain S-box protein [Oscillatoria sp. PCC 10802]
MQPYDCLTSPPSLDLATDRHPLTVTPDTPVTEVVALLSHRRGQSCPLSGTHPSPNGQTGQPCASCVLVMRGSHLTGIFTERDLVKLAAQGGNLRGIAVGEVMASPVISLKQRPDGDIFAALSLLRQHRIRHLPVVGEGGRLVGLVTSETIRTCLQPVNLLRVRQVAEVMATQVVTAPPTASLQWVASLMAQHQVSCVAIVEGWGEKSLSLPSGMITEGDIVQFQGLQIPLAEIQAQQVMSAPVFCVSPEDSLWVAQQQMQRRYVGRLAVTGSQGELLGIVTRTSLLRSLEPVEIYGIAHALQQQVSQLQAEKVELLANRNADLEQRVRERTSELQQQAERERILAAVASRIRQSLNLQDTLNTTVTEVRLLLQCDRVLVYQLNERTEGTIVAESVAPGWIVALGSQIQETCLSIGEIAEEYRKGRKRAISDIYTAGISECHLQLLEHFQVRANLIAPILIQEARQEQSLSPEKPLAPGADSVLWGLLIAHQCDRPRQWQASELDLLDRLSVQIAIAIQQGQLFERTRAELASRLRAEAALRKSEEQYRLLFESNPHPMWVYEIETLAFLAVNQAAISHYGYSREEFLAMSVAEIRPAEEVAKFREAVSKPPNNLYKPGVWKHKKKDGTIIEVEITRHPITWSGRPARLILANDITERQRAEEALRQSERRYATLAEAAPVGIFRTNARGKCVYVNERWYEIAGITAQESLGTGWLRSLHPEDKKRVWSEWYQAVRELRPFRSEYRFVGPDGSVVWVFGQAIPEKGSSSEITGYIGTVTDITQRKLGEEALHNLVAGTAAVTGEDFFPALARHLALALGVRHAHVTEKAGERLQTLAFWSNGQLQSGYTFAISGTPCEVTLAQGIYSCPEGVRQQFPDARVLALLAAESYLGVALTDSAGLPIGVLCILDSHKLPDLQRASAIVRVFGARAAAELERKRASRALQQLADHLELRVTERTAELADAIRRLQQEIAEREQAQRESLAVKERLQYLLSTGSTVIYSCNPEGDFGATFISDSCAALLGYEAREFLEESSFWLNHVHPEDAARLQAEMPSLFERGHHTYEYRFAHGDGAYRWIRDEFQQVRDAAGNILEIVGSMTDITDRVLAEQAVRQQLERERLVVGIAQRIRESLDLDEILNTTVAEVRQVLAADRVLVYRVWPNGTGSAIAEAVAPGPAPVLNIIFPEEVFPAESQEQYVSGRVCAFADRNSAELLPCMVELMEQLQVKAKLVVPILQQGVLWGLLIAHQCSHAREWQPWEIELLQQLATQLAIAIGQSELYNQLQAELGERKLAEAQLKTAKEQLQAVLDAVPGFVSWVSSDLRYLGVNQHMAATLNLTPEDFAGQQVGFLETRPNLAEWMRQFFAGQASATSQVFDVQIQDSTQNYLIVAQKYRPGTAAVFVGIDITERTQAEEQLKGSLREKELLLKEVHHRVKNNLQVISSIFSLQSQYIEAPQILSILEDSQNRIASMALIHEKLYQSDTLAQIDFADYIQHLASNLFLSYNVNPEKIRTQVRVEHLCLSLDTAIPCGLLLNELVTNSLKHAFPGSRSGEIAIELSAVSGDQLRLVVRDSGIGFPESFDLQKTNTLGLRLIRVLTRQLRGKIEIYSRDGAVCELTFPLPK